MTRKLPSGPTLAAVAGVVISVAIAVVVNVLTDNWSWVALGVLVALTATAAVMAMITAAPSRQSHTTVTQSVSDAGRISDSDIRAGRGAEVNEHATNHGVIRRSDIDATNASVRRVSDGGVIEDSSVVAD